jgi:hypothetical protein
VVKTICNRRAATFVTVLRRRLGWGNEDLSKLSYGLSTTVLRDPYEHPECLLVKGYFDPENVARILGLEPADFEHQVVQGLDNPALPFVPNFTPNH